jgi:hypothetical protein
MTQTSVCKHVGHGGLAGEELTKSSTHRSSNKKVGEDRDLHNLSIYAPVFEGGVMSPRKSMFLRPLSSVTLSNQF